MERDWNFSISREVFVLKAINVTGSPISSDIYWNLMLLFNLLPFAFLITTSE